MAAAARDRGEALPAEIRTKAEPWFGHEFGSVRVHRGAAAAESSRALGAKAYTIGDHVMLGEGAHPPSLLAHELAHVVQQRTSPEDPGRLVSSPGDPSEVEADRAADAFTAGRPLDRPLAQGSVPVPKIQRAPAPQSEPVKQPEPAKGPEFKEVKFEMPGGPGLQSFHAALTSECELVVQKRVSIDFIEPTHVGSSFTTWKGHESEQDEFKRKFFSTSKDSTDAVGKLWSGKFPLVPDGECKQTPCPVVTVRVQVVEDPSGSDGHVVVSRTDPESGFPPPESKAFSSGQIALASSDVDLRQSEGGRKSVRAAHEIGHSFGLKHIAWKPGMKNLNAVNAYGEGSERDDVMGKGTEVSEADYAPFLAALNQLTAPCTWKIKSKSFGQRLLEMLGFVAGGALLGGLIGYGARGSMPGLKAAGIGALIGGAVGLIGGAIYEAAT